MSAVTGKERPAQLWDGPVLVFPDGSVRLAAEVAGVLASVIDAYVKAEQRVGGGGVLSPLVCHVRNSLVLAARQVRSGHADIRIDPEPELCDAQTPSQEWINMSQAAEILGCTREHANRLALAEAFGVAPKNGKRRRVRRHEVEAHRAMRERSA